MLSDTLNKYIETENLQVLGQPLPKMDEHKHYNWDFTDDFEFDYELGLAPDFSADFSTADKLTQYVIKADEEVLAERIKNLRKGYGKMTNPDVSAEDDVLYSELVQLSPDGSVFEDGITNTASVRLDQIKDEAIKASLIGLKKGDEVTLDIQKAFNNNVPKVAGLLKIDEELAADLKSNFRLTVKNVNRLEESDLNQEFFDKLFGEGEVTTEDEFRQRITGEIEAMAAQDAERSLQEDIYKYTLNKVQFSLPDDFLKRWLQSNDEKMSAEDLEGGYNDFAQNLKWTLIVNKIISEQKIEVKYEDVFETAKFRLGQQFRMYSQMPLSDEQLGQYTVQYLQNKENANKIFDEVKALKVFNYIKSVVTLEPKEISYSDFQKLV
jgi:trigger factor